jgi:hypothetical protein
MKKIVYILSILVLFLTAIPCIDKPKDNILQKSEISQSTNNNNHHSDTDHCSPFCTCQCCQTNFFVPPISASSIVAELEIRYSEYSPSFQSLYQFDFYIPPKA